MVIVTIAYISDDFQKVDESGRNEQLRLDDICLTVYHTSNIKDCCNTADVGLMVASRVFEKLHMPYKRFAMIRKNWAIALVSRGAKTFDAILPLFDMFNEQAARIVQCCGHIVINQSTSGWHGKDDCEWTGPPH
jgi:hypothetical protein